MMVQVHYATHYRGTVGVQAAIQNHLFKRAIVSLVRQRTIGRQVNRMTATCIPALYHGQGRWQSVPRWQLVQIKWW